MDPIDRQAAIDVLNKLDVSDGVGISSVACNLQEEAIRSIENLLTAQLKTCEGCKHLNKWENEVEYGYPSPCTCCKRRMEDNYER